MRFKLIFLGPVLAFLTLGAWALASPVGAAPDDDYHLTSIWCATGNPDACLPGTDSLNRRVGEALIYAPCYAFDEDKSAACQEPYFAGKYVPDMLNDRGNFEGAYPPLYYKAMSVFVGPDVTRSAIVMRIVNVILFVALSSLVFLLLPAARRRTLLWGWLITLVPLGLFLIASNNPSGWAITGVGTAWIALLGYFETKGRARVGLGMLFSVATLMAAGSRADSAFYIIVAIAVVLGLKFVRARAFLVPAILPLCAAAVAAAFLFSAGQIGSGIHGFSGPASTDPSSTGADAVGAFSLLAYNLLNLPNLWAGVFGGWGLGWLDTTPPPIVMWGATAAFVAVGFSGLARIDRRKAGALAIVGGLLVAVPIFVLQRGGNGVGVNVQPRYLLPLIVLLGGLLMLEPVGRRISLGRAQLAVVGAALIVANLASLHTNIQRYVTGVDVSGLNLNAGREWWWSGPVSPMFVWGVGSLAFAGLVAILLREIDSACDRSAEPISEASQQN